MVIGMDFYKDSEKKKESVAAFVASMNGTQDNKLNGTKYYSRCQMQPRGQEFLNNLKGFMIDAIFKYKEKNGVNPERIFVYRDGVNDGQFKAVEEYEIKQMREAFSSIDENYK